MTALKILNILTPKKWVIQIYGIAIPIRFLTVPKLVAPPDFRLMEYNLYAGSGSIEPPPPLPLAYRTANAVLLREISKPPSPETFMPNEPTGVRVPAIGFCL